MDRLASCCRHCRFYTPEGRRGGHCGQLGVSVSGSWQSCDLSLSPFAPSWESSEAFPENRHGRIVGGAVQVPDPKIQMDSASATNSAWTSNVTSMDSQLLPQLVPQLVNVER